MGTRLEKLKRMQHASSHDELPLVKYLGLRLPPKDVWKNEAAGGWVNKKHGDVSFRIRRKKGRAVSVAVYSIESQVVSDKSCYDKFSYTANKVDSYRGEGMYDNAWVMLGCYEVKGDVDSGMIYVMLPAKCFHEYLETAQKNQGSGVYLNDPPDGKGGKYYTARPEGVVCIENAFVGDSVGSVVNSLLDYLGVVAKS